MIASLLFLGCGEPPIATFQVACDDADCTVARFDADDASARTAFAWLVDGNLVAEGPSYSHQGVLGIAERVELQTTNFGGMSSSEVWVVANQAMVQDAVGAWEPSAQGFEVVSEGGRSVDTECPLGAVVLSIGGCFTTDTPFALSLSAASSDPNQPPTPVGGPDYAAPATFVPGPPTPAVARGAWDGVRAIVDAGEVADGWNPSTPSASGALPRFEALLTPANATDGHWAVLSLPGQPAAFHENAIYVQCDGSTFTVGASTLDAATLDAWARATR